MHLKFWQKIKVSSDLSWNDRVTYAIAEFFGSGIVLFAGCMGCAFHHADFVVEKAFSFGLAFVVSLQCFGPISGGHINPLLTIAAIISGKTALVDSIFYFLGQLIGAFAGFGFLRVILDDYYIFGSKDKPKNYPPICCGLLNEFFTELQGLFTEFMISFILVLAISAIWDNRNKHKPDSVPLRFGFVIIGLAIAAGPYTDAHMNPFRSLVPAVVNNCYDLLHVYIGGELLGGILGSLFYAILLAEAEDKSEGTDVAEA